LQILQVLLLLLLLCCVFVVVVVIVIIMIIVVVSRCRAFLHGTSPVPTFIPTTQASHCTTFHIMCNVPSIAVFCSETIECLPNMASKFFFKPFVRIGMAPIITSMIIHFMFQVCFTYKILIIIIII